MQKLSVINSTETMSSLEISKLTKKEHSKVCSDIERILKEAKIDAAGFSGIYSDSSNRKRNLFNLPRRERVFDQNYGTVNSYHIDVWLAVYGVGR